MSAKTSWPKAWTSRFGLVLFPTRQRRCGEFSHGRGSSSRRELPPTRAGAPPLVPTDLAQHAIILGPASLDGHWSFRKGDTATSFQVEGKLTISASLGAIAAAVEGLGIVMTPLGVCRRELERGELVRLLPELDAGTVELNAVYASGRAAKPSARAVVDYLIAAIHEDQAPASSPRSLGKKHTHSA